MLQARSMFSCNQNKWGYSIASRPYLLFKFPKETQDDCDCLIQRQKSKRGHSNVARLKWHAVKMSYGDRKDDS